METILKGKRSLVDKHPKREQIIKDLLTNTKLATLELKYGIPAITLSRYRTRNLARKVAAAKQRRDADDGDYILKQIEEVQGIVRRVLTSANAASDWGMTLAAAREFRAGCELLAQMYGKIGPRGGSVTIINNPQWVQIREVILDATEGAPEVRERIVSGLDGLNA